jgi:hypothetical protein
VLMEVAVQAHGSGMLPAVVWRAWLSSSRVFTAPVAHCSLRQAGRPTVVEAFV